MANKMQNKLVNIINVLTANKLRHSGTSWLFYREVEPLACNNGEIFIKLTCMVKLNEVKLIEGIGGLQFVSNNFKCNEFELLYKEFERFDDINLSVLCENANLIDNVVNQICVMFLGIDWESCL